MRLLTPGLLSASPPIVLAASPLGARRRAGIPLVMSRRARTVTTPSPRANITDPDVRVGQPERAKWNQSLLHLPGETKL